MAYINLPTSLDQMFNDLGDRLSRVETGYNGPQVSADAAQGTAVQASTQATIAQAQATVALQAAQAAYAAGAQSIQISAQTIVNASNQLTAMNTNGITVYSGASSTSGARVVMNSAGIAGFDTYGVTTFAIDATNGNVSTTGAVFTQSTISGGSLNINGNAIIDTSGYLTARGATIQGTIYATSGSFTGSISSTSGSIGGWTLASDGLYSGASTYLKTNGSASFAGVIYSISPPQFSWTPTNSYGYMTSLQVGVQMNIVGGYGVVGGWGPLTSNAYDLGVGANSYQWNHIYLHNAAIVNSDARLKTNVKTSTLGLDFINSLRPVSYKMISGGNKVNLNEEGNPIVIGKDANGKDILDITSIAGKRTHWGFLAQEVKEAIDKSGVEDFGGWVLGDLSDPESYQALAYEQFIAPLTKAVQELSTRLDQLEGK
jgi:hypothetical protein